MVVEAHVVVGVGVGEVVVEKAMVVEEEAHVVVEGAIVVVEQAVVVEERAVEEKAMAVEERAVEEAVVVVEEEAGVRGGRGGRCVKPAHQAGRYCQSGGELQSRQCLLEIQVPY